MGRKKKQTEEFIPTKTRSTLAYYGTVKIEVLKGDKVWKTIIQHNTGTSELFRYLANALAGTVSNNLMPRYVHIFFNENADPSNPGNTLWGDDYSQCSMNIPFANVEVRYDATIPGGGYNTEYTFMLPYNQLKEGYTNVVCLYNTTKFGDNKEPLAYIILDRENWLDIARNNTANIVIKWVMTVCNGEIVE